MAIKYESATQRQRLLTHGMEFFQDQTERTNSKIGSRISRFTGCTIYSIVAVIFHSNTLCCIY